MAPVWGKAQPEEVDEDKKAKVGVKSDSPLLLIELTVIDIILHMTRIPPFQKLISTID